MNHVKHGLALLLGICAAPAAGQDIGPPSPNSDGFAIELSASESTVGDWHSGYLLTLSSAQTLIFADDFESGTTGAWGGGSELPSGAILLMASDTCPSGWSPYSEGRGRTVVGRPAGGTLGAIVGQPLGDLELREHSHQNGYPSQTGASSGLLPHSHRWSLFNDTYNVWWTWSGMGTPGGWEIEIIDWGDGLGNEGSGYYPLSVKDYPSNPQLWTQRITTDHTHGMPPDADSSAAGTPLPFHQLLICRKD